MDRGQGVEGSEFGTFATEDVAIGAGEQQTLTFVAGQFARAFDLSFATVVARLF